MNFLKIVSIFFLFYALFMYAVFCLSLWFILKKEKKKEILSIIPILNFYEYYKICKSPFWTFFIPFLNIIVLICLPYRLAYQYNSTKVECVLACLFPFAYLPFIALSDKVNKDIPIEFHYIKNGQDIENLENRLSQAYEEENIYQESPYLERQEHIVSSNEEINYSDFEESIIDEYVYNDESPKEEKVEEMIELIDEEKIVDNTLIDLMEEKGNSDIGNREVETTIEEVEEEMNTEAIAFGGVSKEESLAQAKKDDLKCPRCGSSLVGATGFCPGCGNKLD